jgi:hypothetical protein
MPIGWQHARESATPGFSRQLHSFDLDPFCVHTAYWLIGEPIAVDSFGKKENRMAHGLQVEITMESRLGEIQPQSGSSDLTEVTVPRQGANQSSS